MLLRTQDCVINTDTIAYFDYQRGGVGVPARGFPGASSLVIHFIGGGEKTFRGNEADELWAHLIHEVQDVRPNRPRNIQP